jgi:hypothetical protein
MGSRSHRVVRGLAGGCALLLAVGVTACSAPPSQYTDVSDSTLTLDFKVPHSWHQINGTALRRELEQVLGQSSGPWGVAYEAGPNPQATDFLAFGIDQPFVFAESGALTTAASATLTYDGLRNSFLPVTPKARSDQGSGFPLTGFKQIRDQVLKQGDGVHGVRETFDYTLQGSQADTFDEIALANADGTFIYFLVIHCTTSCYNSDRTAINDVMSSFAVSTSPLDFMRYAAAADGPVMTWKVARVGSAA